MTIAVYSSDWKGQQLGNKISIWNALKLAVIFVSKVTIGNIHDLQNVFKENLMQDKKVSILFLKFWIQSYFAFAISLGWQLGKGGRLEKGGADRKT